MEQAQDDESRKSALEAMIENDLLEGSALGIAKKIIGDNSIANLSDKQSFVFRNEISPHFEIACETEDCGNMIAMDEVADAIRNREAGQDVHCPECQYTFRDRGDDD
ncbi:hypothetical protein ACFOY5_03960 [Massilia aurea]|uniref:hypothetical protein n=1 Tax=Massilia aurea TaxID=373040 RepID=UPI0021633CFC|nr:hypothetical protein [Massilia aurea]MCS0707350.1 hypothetical protein [Massilia aurea]